MRKEFLSIIMMLIAFNLKAQWNESVPNQITTLNKIGIGTNLLNIGNTGINDLVIGDASGSQGLIVNANSNNDGILAFASDGNMVSRFIYNNPSGTLHYYKHGVGYLFTVLKNGNVGIGTINPKSKLSVNGTIWAKEVKVTLVDAADWVFADNYELEPLEEVENFIKDNKHLPDVPSAEEFRKNDMNLAEMNNVLLQKVEELTLYLIEQNKISQAQQEKIEQLEKKVISLEKK